MDKMIYFVPHPFTIKCKYVAKMEDLYFALFIVDKNNSDKGLILDENSRIKFIDNLMPYNRLLDNFSVIQFIITLILSEKQNSERVDLKLMHVP